MKILAVSYLFPNSHQLDFGIFVLNRLKALSKYCDLKVINPIPWFPGSTVFSRYRPYRNLPLQERLQGVEVYHPRFLSIPRFLKGIEVGTFRSSVFSIVKKVSKDFHFDILDVHWTFPDLPACLSIAGCLDKKLVITLRGKEALISSGEKRFKNLLVPALERADHIISLSQEMIDLCKAGGVRHSRFSLIRNGADTKSFYFMNREEARKKLGLPQDKIILLSVGSLIYRKGFDRIIKNLKHISKTFPNTTLYIIGKAGPEGNYERTLKKICNENQVVDKVYFVGSVPNASLVNWYNAADVFCLASRGEGSPNVLSEALACGCPSVSTNVGSAQEILSHSWMGEVVDNTDNAFLNGLKIALSKKYDRSKIASHMAQFDWDWCARQVVEVFDSVSGKLG